MGTMDKKRKPSPTPRGDDAEAAPEHGSAESLVLAASGIVDVEMTQNIPVDEQLPRHHLHQNHQQQQFKSSNSALDSDTITDRNFWIKHYLTNVSKLYQSVNEIQSRIKIIESRIKIAENAFRHLKDLDAFFEKEENCFLGVALDPEDNVKANRKSLRKYINEEKESLKEEKESLDKENECLYQENERLRAIIEGTSKPKTDGITGSKADKEEWESGLLHVEDTLRISLVQDKSIDIGIIESAADRKPPFKLRDDIGTWEPCRELIDAWYLVKKDSTDSDFFEKLYVHTDKLNEKRVRNACRALNFEFNMVNNNKAGEMLMQQQLLSPFTMLLNAAASGDFVEAEEYRADEDVSASRAVLCKETETDSNPISRRISIRPCGAVTLRDKYDTFGMIEMKRADHMHGDEWFRDIDKCAMMTAATATIVRDVTTDKTLHRQVAIPFIVAAGKTCSLYITTLDEGGNPCIQLVKYPDSEKQEELSSFNDLGVSPSRERVRFFVTFAVLLNKFKTLFEKYLQVDYERKFVSIFGKIAGMPTYSLINLKKKDKDPQSKEDRQTKSRTKTQSGQQQGKSAEKSAKEAAECGGRFSDVKYPFIRSSLYTDEGMVDDEQQSSPFYFTACATALTKRMTSNYVFLKVWKEGDVDLDCLLLEWENHRRALQAGVPVATPVFDNLVRSTTTSGTAYIVFAVEYIHEDKIQDETHFLKFCTSLIETVVKLHEEAGLLHCDIKPANLCWRKQVVTLIDFGHSQPIDNATWSRGTEGFEAPEIVESAMPCSTKTDAYAVGATIVRVLQDLDKSIQQNHLCMALHDIALKLKHLDPGTRWSLPQALRKIHSIHGKNEYPHVVVKKFKANQYSSLMCGGHPVEAE